MALAITGAEVWQRKLYFPPMYNTYKMPRNGSLNVTKDLTAHDGNRFVAF